MRLHRNPLCLLAVVALWLALPLQSLNAQSKPYDWVFNPSNGHWYAPTNSAMSWTSAQSEAAFVHGHLATIRTAEEEEFLFRHVIKGSTQNYWIGLNDISSPNTFVWDSGENYQYRNWAPGEPNNQGGIEGCVILRGQHRDWNDWPEAGPALGLIEVELTQWVVNPANGTRYGRTPAMMSWTEAEALAVSLGGHLVTIDNADEESFLLDTFLVDVADNFWIGYYQNHDPPNYSEPDGGWEWISGSSTYEHWAPGEPNNYNGNEDFAILRGQHRDWNDWSDAARAWGIMELPAPTWTVHPTTGHYYAVGRGLTWAPAELEAMQLGGHLATIEDSAENAWLYTAFGSPSGSQDSLYIGFTDERTPGSLNQFEWSSLSTSTYANWASGEPNNRFNDQYVFMQMDAQYSGSGVVS